MPPQRMSDLSRSSAIKRKCAFVHLFTNVPFGFDDPSALPNVFYDPQEFGIRKKANCLNNELRNIGLKAKVIADEAMARRDGPG